MVLLLVKGSGHGADIKSWVVESRGTFVNCGRHAGSKTAGLIAAN